MALEKKGGFSFDVESKFKDKKLTDAKEMKGSKAPLQEYDHIHEDNAEDNHEDKVAPKPAQFEVSEPEKKELKQRKVNFLTYESLDDRITAYAKKRGVKKVAVFEAAMIAYLDMVDPIEEKK